jgi:nitroreductase
MSTSPNRVPDHDIAPLFFERSSRRAFADDPISDADLFSLFEAARWAPSARNAQPWRFLYARHSDRHWDTFAGLILPRNRVWTDRAAVLIFLLSARSVTQDGRVTPLVSHSLDAGAAWAQLALQAHLSGWSAIAIGGFDRDRAPEVLNVSDDFTVEIGIAVGRPGQIDRLPEDLREREVPNGRRPVKDLVTHGPFGQ